MARFRNFGPQRKRKTSRTPKSAQASVGDVNSRQPLIRATPGGRAWQLTENWIVSVAEPRFANAIREALQLTAGDAWAAIQRHYLNPIDVTYYILQGQIPLAETPLKTIGDERFNFMKLQSDNPQLENYYKDGATLDLYRKIHRKVQAGLLRLRKARSRKGILLFPV